MPSFSQRHGYTQTLKPLQIEGYDKDLLNSLWNIYLVHVVEKHEPRYSHEQLNYLKGKIWRDFLKEPIDEAPYNYENLKDYLKTYFFSRPWYEVYNLIEFSLSFSTVDARFLTDYLNFVFKREFAGYRVLNEEIIPISNELEVNELKEALDNTKHYTSIKESNLHLSNSLTLLSNKENPDYRNAIKEAISAVETAVRVITGESTLGAALRRIETSGIDINNQLKESFSKIYNYTNASDVGIRHAIVDQQNPPDFETAKYLLVTSSAFINYLVGLSVKANILK